MGSTPESLARELRDELGLVRAVETGTYHGGAARLLAGMFGEVVTVELSTELAEAATANLSDLGPAVRVANGDSRQILPTLVDPARPTYWFLDGHWSGGPTAGETDECPVLNEIALIGAGHPNDCIVIDDARYFLAAPPPPHDSSQWPSIGAVFDALREERLNSHVTLLGDQVVCVPASAKLVVDSHVRNFMAGLLAGSEEPPRPQRGLAGLLRRH